MNTVLKTLRKNTSSENIPRNKATTNLRNNNALKIHYFMLAQCFPMQVDCSPLPQPPSFLNIVFICRHRAKPEGICGQTANIYIFCGLQGVTPLLLAGKVAPLQRQHGCVPEEKAQIWSAHIRSEIGTQLRPLFRGIWRPWGKLWGVGMSPG